MNLLQDVSNMGNVLQVPLCDEWLDDMAGRRLTVARIRSRGWLWPSLVRDVLSERAMQRRSASERALLEGVLVPAPLSSGNAGRL